MLSSLGLIATVLAAFYYCSVQPGEWLGWWAKLVNGTYERWALGKNGCHADRFDRYHWLLKPILTCERCIGGQVGIWLCVGLLVVLHTFSLLALFYVAGLASIGSGLLVKLVRL
jgi:hypothetical protein